MTWAWIVGALVLLGAGLHVEVLPPTDDERVAALLRQARERWVTAGGVPAQARTEEEYRLAERICVEGLALVKEARS